MQLSKAAISNPIAVVCAVLLVLLVGTIGLLNLPVQMIPDLQRPSIQIDTRWRTAAPEEVESEIIEPQEDVLRGLPGLIKMESSASSGRADISLMFSIETDLQRALIEVLNRLNQVPRYPNDVTEPQIYAGEDRFGSNIAWYALTPVEGNTRPIASYSDFAREVVQARLERVPGVSNSIAFGGRDNEVRITFDPYKAAALGIDIPTLTQLVANHGDSSAGFSEVGRRQYTLRYAGQYALSDFGEMVLDWGDGQPVRLRDIATIDITMRDAAGYMTLNGNPSIAMSAQVEQGVNVLEVMAGLDVAVAELRAGPLQRAGLKMTQDYDESIYIRDSVAMLRTNLLIGVALAIGILWWFLRRFRATCIIALAIPISLFTAFIVMQVTGRTLNMISLAGLAFATGMVLDAAIVILENIVRLREQGASKEEAAVEGASQVSGALLASTATTVVIFLPIIFLQDISGQIFSDLALVISAAVVASLIIAMTVIPTASAAWIRSSGATDRHAHWWDSIAGKIMWLTDRARTRKLLVGGLFSGSILLSVLFLPATDYLPKGQQGFIFTFIDMPPGQSVTSSKEEFANVVRERLFPYLQDDAELKIDSVFLGKFGSSAFSGVQIADATQTNEVVDKLNNEIFAGFPGTVAFASEQGIFDRVGDSNAIELNIQSRDMASMFTAARAGMRLISEHLPGAQTRPVPGVDIASPELRIIPDERRITEAGWTRPQMSTIVRALGDGVYVGDYFDGDRGLDVVLRAPEWTSPEQLAATPLATPNSGIQPLDQLVTLKRTAGPDRIRRVDRRRALTLVVSPPDDVSLEEAIDILQTKVEPELRQLLPDDGEISYYGSADDLKTALSSMSRSFGLAIIVLYLLMSALFRSFVDSLFVIVALPLAMVGGVTLLRVMGLPMDLLTMIGFITLLGLVVNNAILLVHQTRSAERDGLDRHSSVEQAVRRRLRPILMSTMTSLFGMLPLLLIPGPGSEVYAGLAAVIVGGMAVSTAFTLIFLPSLLRMGETNKPEHLSSAQPTAAG